MIKTNIEKILEKLISENIDMKSCSKLDGITIECSIITDRNIDEEITRVKKLCKDLKLPSQLFEKNLNEENKYIIQFPNLEPYYTEKQMEHIIEHFLIILLNNTYYNDLEGIVNKQVIKENSQMFINEVLTMVYKSNVNRYKHTLKDYINNEDNRLNVKNIFEKTILEYEYKGKKVNIKKGV